MRNISNAAREKCFLLQSELEILLPASGDYVTSVNGLTLYRRERTNKAEDEGLAEPHATIVFQGAEKVRINGRNYICRPCQCRVTGQEVFGTGHIAEASSDQPFLAASLSLDFVLINELSEKAAPLINNERITLRKISVEDTDTEMLDAFLRLIRLLRNPERLSVLTPIIIREIHYLLLVGPHSRHLKPKPLHWQ